MIPHLFYYQLVVLGLLWLCVMLHAVWPSRGRIGKSNGIFAPVSPGAHPRNPTTRTPQRLGVPLPVPAGRRAGCGE